MPVLTHEMPCFASRLANLRQSLAPGSVDVIVAANAARIERAAQQLVDRHSERLAANIPQRLIDARYRGSHHRTGAIEGVNVHRLPDVLDLHRIRADQKVAEIVDAGHDGAGFAFERALAPADQALVGFELDEYVGPVGVRRQRDAEDFQAGDFQTGVHDPRRL